MRGQRWQRRLAILMGVVAGLVLHAVLRDGVQPSDFGGVVLILGIVVFGDVGGWVVRWTGIFDPDRPYWPSRDPSDYR